VFIHNAKTGNKRCPAQYQKGKHTELHDSGNGSGDTTGTDQCCKDGNHQKKREPASHLLPAPAVTGTSRDVRFVFVDAETILEPKAFLMCREADSRQDSWAICLWYSASLPGEKSNYKEESSKRKGESEQAVASFATS
jgi:hypothetical protein